MAAEDAEAALESTPLLPKSRSNTGLRASSEQAERAPVAETLPTSLARSTGLNTSSAMKAGYLWFSAFSCLLASILLVILMYTRRVTHIHKVDDPLPLPLAPAAAEGKHKTDGSFPHPPEPYEYSSFLSWLDEEDLQGYGFKLIPKRSWFDDQKAMEQKSKWFENEDMTNVLKAFEGVDRWSFMQDIMRTGREEIQAAVAPHLLTMRWLQDKLNKARTVLDMGCGTGVLLRYLQVFARQLGNDKLRAVGFDSQFVVVQMANTLLKAEGHRVPGLQHPYLYTADMYQTKEMRTGLEHPKPLNLPPFPNLNSNLSSNVTEVVNYDPVHRIDLVIVGAALGGTMQELELKVNETRDERAKHMISKDPLKTIWMRVPIGGSMVLPVCKAILKKGETCKADFFLIGKNGYGNPQIEHGGTQDTEFEMPYRQASSSEGLVDMSP